MQTDSTRERLASSATRILAIFGFVAILVIGMWGSVQIARNVPGTLSSIASAIVSFTSIFVPSTEVIKISSESLVVQSGAPTTLTFSHESKSVEGTYTFTYGCVEGVSIALVDASDRPVSCGERVAISSTGAFVVRPVTLTNRFADVEVFVAFTPVNAGTPTVTGSTLVTIENQSITKSPSATGTAPTTPSTSTTPATPKPQTPTKPVVIQIPVQKPSDPNGYVDLVARVIEVGVVDSSGAFTASSSPSRFSRVAVRFAIENVGTKTSREFTFSSVLPTYPPYTYFSTSQPVLNPGDRIEYTIGFDATKDASSVEFIVNVDPTGTVNEKNKDNNIMRYTIYVTR